MSPEATVRRVIAAALLYLAINVALGFLTRRSISRKRVRALAAALDVAFTSYLVFLTGGENSVWYVLYIFPVLSASRYLNYEGSLLLALVAAGIYALAAVAANESLNLASLFLKTLLILGISFVAGNLSRTRRQKEDDLVDVFRIIDNAIIADAEIDQILKIILERAVAFTESNLGEMIVFGEDQVSYFVSIKSDQKQSEWEVQAFASRFHRMVRQTKRPVSVLTIKQRKRTSEAVEDNSPTAKSHIYILSAYVDDPNMPRAALFVPLVLNNEVRAIISLYSKNSFHYFDIDTVKLESLALALGIALKHSSEIEKTKRLKLLHTIGEALKVEQGLSEVFETVVALTWSQLSSEEAALFVANDKGADEIQITKVAVKGPTPEITTRLMEFEASYKSGESLVGGIFASKQLLHLHVVPVSTLDYHRYSETLPSRTVRDYIGVPIVIGDEILGVLRVINKRSASYSLEDANFALADVGFDIDDVELMQTIASQVASAIRSAKFIEVNRNYRELVENSPDPIIVLDRAGNIKIFNRACETIFGYGANEVIGKSSSQFYESEEHAREIGKLLKTGPYHRLQDFQARIKARDGEIIPISLSATLLFDTNRQSVGSLGIFKDLRFTHKLQQEKTNAERLATLGKLAHTVGHEIKHDLATALNYIDVLAFESRGDEELAEVYHEIQASLIEAIDKFQNMLLVGRPRPPKKEVVGAADLFHLVEPSLRRNSESKGVNFVISYPDERRELEADLGQLRQVLFNLFYNSLDAITSRGLSQTEKGRIDCVANVSGCNLKINWTDNGCGIPRQKLDTVFAAFATSKPNGNGLGLFIVKNIVENHDGQITVESEEGKGTTFTIVIPLYPDGRST